MERRLPVAARATVAWVLSVAAAVWATAPAAAQGDPAADPETPPLVLVTHHADEIPDGFTHALLLRDGAVLAAGPMDETLTSKNLSECFGLDLTLERRHGRWTARAGS